MQSASSDRPQKQVCVSTDLRGYFVIDTLYYMHARARARARPRRRKSVFFSALVQRLQHDGRLVAPREHGPDAGEDATPVVCRRQHDKALPGCHREDLWAVSGPQRGTICKEAFAYHTIGWTHRDGGLGPAEAARARSSGSPTVRSGPVDAQPPLQCTANRGGRQRISTRLQK